MLCLIFLSLVNLSLKPAFAEVGRPRQYRHMESIYAISGYKENLDAISTQLLSIDIIRVACKSPGAVGGMTLGA